MHVDELVRLYPLAYHIAEAGSWPSIATHGLRTSEQLCDLFGVPGARRRDLLTERRARKVVLEHETTGRAVLRDQGPLSPIKLSRCLTDDLTVADWLALLNERVFFWLQENRRDRMLAAYAGQEHDVLTVDTASLLDAHESRARLSRINSGSTAYRGQPRGLNTFQRIADYPHPSRRRALASASDIAELAIIGGVDDILEHVVEVVRLYPDGEVETLYVS